MRKPETPPELSTLIPSAPERLAEIMRICGTAADTEDYFHWDEVRRRRPPDSLSVEEWWLGTKLIRQAQSKRIPLRDTNGNPFQYVNTDLMQRSQRHVDLMTGGKIEMPEQITNPQTRDRYYISSLMEEAITSSQLEGAAVTRRDAKEMLRTQRKPRSEGEKMILNNYLTMRALQEFSRQKLTPELILEIHRLITDSTLEDPASAGRLRLPNEPIKVTDQLTDEILHIPPDAHELPGRINQMCAFANEQSTKTYIHPVIRAIILHFWLAYDHPFVDGNGRTARALFYWSMLRNDYWLFEFVSISTILRKAPVKYSRAYLFTETDDNDLTYFIHYNLEVIERGVQELLAYVRRQTTEVRAVEDRLGSVRALNRRQKELLSHALRHPFERYTYQSHRDSHGISRQTARTDILGLFELGFLEQSHQGRQLYFRPVKELDKVLGALSAKPG